MVWSPPGQAAPQDRWRYDLAKKAFTPPGVVSATGDTQVVLPQDFNRRNGQGFHLLTSPAGNQAPLEHINYTPETGEIHGRGQQAPIDKLNYSLIPESALHTAPAGSGHTAAGGRGGGGLGGGGGAGNMGAGLGQDPNQPVAPQDQPGAPALPGDQMGTWGRFPELAQAAQIQLSPPPPPPQKWLQPGQPSMGAGAVQTLSAIGPMSQKAPGAFAGTPPLSGSPSMTGPSATTNRAAPTWGGGGTPMAQRMGMGADSSMGAGDEWDNSNPSGQPASSTSSSTSTSEDTGGAGYPAGSTLTKPTTPQPASSSSNASVPSDAHQIFDPTTHQLIGYWVPGKPQYPGQPEDQIPRDYHWLSSTATSTTPEAQAADVAYTKAQTEEANSRRALDDANAKEAAARQELTVAQTDAAKQKAQQDLVDAQQAAQKAKDDHDTSVQALQDAQQKARQSAAPQLTSVTDVNGHVYNRDPQTGQLVDTGVISPNKGSAFQYNGNDGSLHLFNPNTNEDTLLQPPDKYKAYTPIKDAQGYIQWDPDATNAAGGKGAFVRVWKDDPTWSTQIRDGQVVATNNQDPTQVKVTGIPETTAEKDTHTNNIDNHNQAMLNLEKTKQDLQTGKITQAQARINVEQSIQNLLHPQPMSIGRSVYIPPGLSLDVTDFSGNTRTVSGGAQDPRVQQAVSGADELLKSIGGDPTNLNSPGNIDITNARTGSTLPGGTQTTMPAGTTPSNFGTSSDPAAPAQPTINPRAGDTAGSKLTSDLATTGVEGSTLVPKAGDPYSPGVPGSDPRLSGQLQPPTKVTTTSGVVTRPAPDPYGLTSGDLLTDDTGDGGAGNMGAGINTPGGWVTRPTPFSRAAGPGWLGGVGSGQADEFDPSTGDVGQLNINTGPGANAAPKPAINTGVGMPMGPAINTGPGPGAAGGVAINTGPGSIGQPGVTDQGSDVMQQIDLLTERVRESLKKLLGQPTLGSPEHDLSGDPAKKPFGVQGGFDVPDVQYGNPQTGQAGPVQQPTDINQGQSGAVPLHREFYDQPHGLSPDEMDEMQQIEGLQKQVDASGQGNPEAQAKLDALRNWMHTLGTGQEGAGHMSNFWQPKGFGVGQAQAPQPTPQNPAGWQPPQPNPQMPSTAGKQKLPRWMEFLLRRHPELLQQAGVAGGPVSGGSSAGSPPSAGSTAPQPPLGGGQDMPPQGVPGASNSQPGAPGPGGAPMQPPLPPGDVAGIGHRFGQQMDVGEPQHSGVDLQAPEGTPTQSPVDGVVEDVQNNPQGLGVTVVIRGKDGSQHKLGHLSKTKAYRGMQVARGQDLGSEVGSTGLSTGAHLHWGVKDQQGAPVDPTPALPPQQQNMPPVPGTEQMGPTGGTGAPPMGGGQDARVGWPPKAPRAKRRWGKPNPTRVGAGRDLPGFGPDEIKMRDPQLNIAELTSGGTKAIWGGEQQQNPAALPKLGDVKINPIGAFGSGQGAAAPTNYSSPDYQQGYQDGMQASSKPGTPPIFTPGLAQPIPGAADASGMAGGPQQMGGGTEAARKGNKRRDPPPVSDEEAQKNWEALPPGSRDWSWISGPKGGEFVGGGSYTLPGAGQDTSDSLWDKYQAREVQGAMGAGAGATTQAERQQQVLAAGYNGPLTDAAINQAYANAATPSDLAQSGISNTPQSAGPSSPSTSTSGGPSTTTKGALIIDPGTQKELANQAAQIAVQQQQETDHHNEVMAQMAQDLAIHKDDLAYQYAVQAETDRHNQATEQLTARQQNLQAQMDQLDNQTKLDIQNMANQSAQQIESMREASQVQIQQMQEGTQIYLQQGQQAFQDWQTRQQNEMSILSSALNNPWLQQLTGMTPPGGAGTPTGGANIAALVQQILQPYDVSAFSAANAPAAANLGGPAQGPNAPALPGEPTAGSVNLGAFSGGVNTGYAPGTFVSKANGEVGQVQNNGSIMAFSSGEQAAAAGVQPGNTNVTMISDQLFDSAVSTNPNAVMGTAGAAGTPTPGSTAGGTSGGTQALGPAVAPPGQAVPGASQGQVTAQPSAQSFLTSGQAAPNSAAGNPNGSGINIPDWSTWQSWSPWQKAAYRANIEALGPGVWAQVQQSLQNSFAAQGGAPDVTQLAAQSANPAEQIGQQMTAEAFGQTPSQWQTQQARQWSQAQAPQVRQNVTQSQGGAASAGATPESQYGV